MTGENYSGSDSSSSSYDSSPLEDQSPAPDQTPMPPMDSGPDNSDDGSGETEVPLVAPIPGATESGATNPTPPADRPASTTIGTGSTIALGCVAAAIVVVFVVILILTIVS